MEITMKNEYHSNRGTHLKGAVMKQNVKKSIAAILAFSLMTLALILSGCGGGGSGEVSSQVVSGTAAVGAPLSGKVSLKDSSTPSVQKSTIIGSDGSFAIDVTSMKAPFVLQATGSANGTEYTLHSFADGTGTANINPLSDIIVASAAGDDDPSDVFTKSDSAKNHAIGTNFAKTVSIVLAKLQPLLKQYRAENTNPITSRYIANHLDLDDMFDHVKITVSQGTLSIINVKSGAVIFTGKISDIANGIFDGGALPPAAAVPTAPTGLTAVGGTGQVTISWTSVSAATSYNVYYATTTGVTKTSGTKIASATPSCLQTGLTAGTMYYYVVTAVNSAGESAVSTQTSVRTAATPPAAMVPAAPAGVSANGGTNQMTLSWGAVSTATSYNVYYAAASGVTTTNGTKIANATSPSVHTGLAAGSTYYYIVTAINSTGESAASVQFTGTTLSATTPGPTAPATPTGVTVAGGTNAATITWPAVSGATSYNVYWSTKTGVTKTSGTKVSGVNSPYTQTGLAAATAYYYVVTAVSSAGEGAASAQVTTTTAAAPVLDGLTLYNANCTSCHGTAKLGKAATAIQGAITANTGGMSFLSSLTAAQIAAIAATTATAPTLDGAALYNANCASCHGTGKRGKSVSAIQSAIASNRGGMGSLSTLTTAQLTAISHY